MKKMYLCSQGDYSDYSIYGVFDDAGLANAFAKTFDCEVEEWALNPYEQEVRNGYKPFLIYMSRDGKSNCHECNDAYPFDEPDLWKRISFARKGDLYLHCLAKNEKHAVKIANEQRTKVIALGMWPEEKDCPIGIRAIEEKLKEKKERSCSG